MSRSLTLGYILGAWTSGARAVGVFTGLAGLIRRYPASYLHTRHLPTCLPLSQELLYRSHFYRVYSVCRTLERWREH
jgi:hypothetical protein